MSASYIIALVILLIAIIGLVTVGVMTKKKISPVIKNGQKCQKRIEKVANFYTEEANDIQAEITTIQHRITALQADAKDKIGSIDELNRRFNSLTRSLDYLKKHSKEYASMQAKDTMTKVKEEAPKFAKIAKLTAINTFKKQKQRFSE
ncbi:DUF948 domain-containing protein [Dolosigranulum savutiense]|uniref:DUF948 domain-containing protein n=1 Tax=Dolosigranulum savutiense TaxID=3110288 RepID=A0AB74U2R4_9LACT